ncbi:MAG TPA: DUF4065 domain-containing protein [Peptococcaceae bacterium]|nr:DUF4065 domain-containing protein [Peptococcaceae bacterium]
MIHRIAEAMLTFGPLTTDKLQKLCYFAYAWYLTFYGERLFREKFEAGEQGPVCPELAKKYLEYGQGLIPKSDKKLGVIINDEELKEYLIVLYDAYGCLNSEQLTELACSEEPWLNARERLAAGGSPVYRDEEIVNWNTRKILRELSRENICFVYSGQVRM